MALKYWFEFTDVKTIVHRVEIYKDDFVGDSTQIYGSCSLEYSETKDTLEPVRGSGLKIDLEANSALTFYDLYSEEERTFSVVYKRDNQILFNGWLSPEGIYESLVSDKWVISLDCTDGLGFLKNLSYVEDATGLNFVGKQSVLEIVVNCLKRTKTPQNILTGIDIYYDGLTQTLDPFANVYFNANRFIKDDNNTIMNCDEVLKSVLEPFGAIITSYKGEWLIYKPNSLFNASLETFFAYDSLGVALGTPSRTIDFYFSLGSQIDSYYPHHANGNQQKTIKSSIGAYRINYKYGLVKKLIKNIYLEHDNTTINDYTIIDGTNLSFLTNKGIRIDATTTSDLVLESTTPISVGQGNFLSFYSEFALSITNNFAKFKIVLTGVSNTYYLNKTNKRQGENINSYIYDTEWLNVDTEIKLESPSTSSIPTVSFATLNIASLPVSGDLGIQVLTPGDNTSPFNGSVRIFEMRLEPVPNNINLKGENHTFQRKLKPSSKIKDVKEVFNGDNPSDIYVGTIYKLDQITPTDSWTRFGASETKPLLQIMGEERMKMYSKPLQVYKGDVYGYFNYLSLVTINGLTGKFMPTTYSYDALSNITSLELTEVLNTDILSDVEYELTFDYGNVVEPTIKG